MTVYFGSTNNLSLYASPKKMAERDFLWEISDCPGNLSPQDVQHKLFGDGAGWVGRGRMHLASYRLAENTTQRLNLRTRFTFTEALQITAGKHKST